MDKIAMLLHLPGTLAHQLEVSRDSTVEQVNLPDGGVAVQIDGQLYQLLPPIEVAGISQAQHDATVQAALAAVQESILLARECRQHLRCLSGLGEQHVDQDALPIPVIAELMYQHWPDICGPDGPVFLLLAEELGLVPTLDEDGAADDERWLSIEHCAA
ncbi:MAG TPA: hypothetical protein VFS21_07120, partial [Roseiflexaceae bacterium]|nr:hypothetical protein [Roseiflexaceae bacterium]